MKKHQHAIVIGGSVAGLVTARVLSDHFGKVTIIDRDTLPEKPVFRKAIPQSHHLHLLLIRGKQILEELFPGFTEEMVEGGAILIDAGNDFLAISPYGRFRNNPTGLHFLASSRVYIEWVIRQRVRKLAGVRVLQKTAVENYIFNEEKTRIIGVKMASCRPAPPRARIGECLASPRPPRRW